MNLWMVRSGSGGRLADEFVEHGVVAMGSLPVGDANTFADKASMLAAHQELKPDNTPGKEQAAVNQLTRFRDGLQKGDHVITYDSSRRIYHLGELVSDYRYEVEVLGDFNHFRKVKWLSEVERDRLSSRARNALGSTLTLFKVPGEVADELMSLAAGHAPVLAQSENDNEEAQDEHSLLESYRSEATEILKDRINRLNDEEMEVLVAGVLRAMGYRTRITPKGSDRAMDIMASPDGFGFESPRIIVEVKHRSTTRSTSKDIRNLVGGRHASDRGLFVSTGGFSKDARYEADRANIPLMLWDLDDLVQALTENYEQADQEVRNLMPMKRLYWPL